MGKAESAIECATLVINKEIEANAATWEIYSMKCFAQIGAASILFGKCEQCQACIFKGRIM